MTLGGDDWSRFGYFFRFWLKVYPLDFPSYITNSYCFYHSPQTEIASGADLRALLGMPASQLGVCEHPSTGSLNTKASDHNGWGPKLGNRNWIYISQVCGRHLILELLLLPPWIWVSRQVELATGTWYWTLMCDAGLLIRALSAGPKAYTRFSLYAHILPCYSGASESRF